MNLSTSIGPKVRRAAKRAKNALTRSIVAVAYPTARGVRLPGGIRLFIEPRRRWIDWNLAVRGSYEPGTVSLINLFLSPGGTFVDVGANIGLLSVHAAKRIGDSGLVFAFEPDPVNFSRLAWARKANEMPCLLPIPFAVGAAPARNKLWRAPSGDGGLSSLVELRGFTSSSSISVTSLDTFFRSTDAGRVDLVKIDVEGFEREVVAGATELLATHKPAVIIEMTTEAAVEAGNLLLGNGFGSYTTAGKGIGHVGQLTRKPPQILNGDNMLFIHMDRLYLLSDIGIEING